MKKDLHKYFIAFISIFFITFTLNIEAQNQSSDREVKKTNIKYKKARALQAGTAKKMAKVYEALEVVDDKGEPDPDMETVLSILTELRRDMANLKSYDRSVMWNAWAFVYFSDGRYDQAMDAYYNLINEPEVTIGLRVGALLSLAQLHLVQENYKEGIELILQWMNEVEKVTAQSYSLLGQAYYQTGDFRKSLSSMETAVTMAEEEGYKPRENWYVIMAACIGELKKEIGEKESLLRQIDIYEILEAIDAFRSHENFSLIMEFHNLADADDRKIKIIIDAFDSCKDIGYDEKSFEGLEGDSIKKKIDDLRIEKIDSSLK